eukprot:TRINITY_DN1904_c0_g1_i10.p3 TRINITY_DN1904_c0_g1~~TRINITY_DN1904_c0_g1_i10.p3  ORF type:complete len:117 (+),score=19.73 TRINITY_DN1904_c0_g1_i10:118-468(+)
MANTEAAEFLRERMRAEQRAYLNHTGTVRRLNPITGRTEVIVYDVPKEPTPEPVLSRPESKRTFSKQEISQYVASADPKHLISVSKHAEFKQLYSFLQVSCKHLIQHSDMIIDKKF